MSSRCSAAPTSRMRRRTTHAATTCYWTVVARYTRLNVQTARTWSLAGCIGPWRMRTRHGHSTAPYGQPQCGPPTARGAFTPCARWSSGLQHRAAAAEPRPLGQTDKRPAVLEPLRGAIAAPVSPFSPRLAYTQEDFEREFCSFIGRNLLIGALLPASVYGVAKAAAQLVSGP